MEKQIQQRVTSPRPAPERTKGFVAAKYSWTLLLKAIVFTVSLISSKEDGLKYENLYHSLIKSQESSPHTCKYLRQPLLSMQSLRALSDERQNSQLQKMQREFCVCVHVKYLRVHQAFWGRYSSSRNENVRNTIAKSSQLREPATSVRQKSTLRSRTASGLFWSSFWGGND